MEPQKYGPLTPSPCPYLNGAKPPAAHSNYRRTNTYMETWNSHAPAMAASTPQPINTEPRQTQQPPPPQPPAMPLPRQQSPTKNACNYKMVVTPAHWHPPSTTASLHTGQQTGQPKPRMPYQQRHSSLYAGEIPPTLPNHSNQFSNAPPAHPSQSRSDTSIAMDNENLSQSHTSNSHNLVQYAPLSVQTTQCSVNNSYQMTGGHVSQVSDEERYKKGVIQTDFFLIQVYFHYSSFHLLLLLFNNDL